MDETTSCLFLAPSDERWMSLIASNPRASIFHHPAWIQVLQECYGYRPMVLAVQDTDGVVVAGCPLMGLQRPIRKRWWVSLPFSDHCVPLYIDTCYLEALTHHLSQLYRDEGLSGIQVRWQLPSDPSVHPVSDSVLSIIDLDPETGNVENRITQRHWRQINKAQKNGPLRIEWETGAEPLSQFYRLHVQTRRRLGVPVQPMKFFSLLGKHVLEPGLGSIALAYRDDECVAATVFLHWQRTLTYKYSASSELGRDLRANFLLLWHAVQWGCTQGYQWLDLGRTDLADSGLRTFKANWGAEETPLIYSVFSPNPPVPHEGRFTPIARAVIRRSPPWVCETTGRLLYRYFG
jgi:hypothetical protein